jgi:hypothetical protein
MTRYREDDDPWWNETRSELLGFYRQVWIACRGRMMAPLLMHPTRMEFNHDLEVSKEEAGDMLRKLAVGCRTIGKV